MEVLDKDNFKCVNVFNNIRSVSTDVGHVMLGPRYIQMKKKVCLFTKGLQLSGQSSGKQINRGIQWKINN